MATRLYYVASTVPSLSPAFDAGWADTSTAVRRLLSTAKAAGTETLSGTAAETGPSYSLAVQLQTPPLDVQFLSGNVTVMSRGRELAATANVNKRARAVKLWAADGTLKATLNAWSATSSTTELSTTMSGQTHAVTAAVTNLDIAAGDVITVEVGYGVGTSGTSPQWEMVLGGTGTDHTSGATNDTAGSVPWLEFSDDLVFLPPGSTVPGSAEAALSFGAAASGVRVVPGVAGASWGFSAAGSGARLVAGAAGAPLGFSGVAAGVRVVPGAAVASLAFSAGGAGVRVAVAAGECLLGFTAAAAGARVVPGVLGAVVGFEAAAAGSTVVVGVAVAGFDFAAALVGSSRTPGAVVPRPDAGVVARPVGVVARPDAGVVVRP
ncbi:hypothetical protein CO540_13300 [Micromonospora sp. WMMA2032]|uniref:hypothetical protein n=1 Tax=Micromonospora sp. WMMA2032 TaxID=2039870 RepID=UPI000C05BABE|nr:hypothetical protein [Micromonospora sp. WMMA2032]ATO14684.1 hypothetical protein CO540_13300 [Micromonospora sp. WMMA2032]